MREQNNSPGFGNGLPLILIRETLNKIYPQIPHCDWDCFGSNDPGAGARPKRKKRIYIYVRVCLWGWRVLDQYTSHPPPTLIHSLSLFISTSCRSLDSSCLSFYDLPMTLILPVCPPLFFSPLICHSFIPPLSPLSLLSSVIIPMLD